MSNPELTQSHGNAIGGRIADVLFKFWHGYTREDNRGYMFWQSMYERLRIDGMVRDDEWISTRELGLSMMPLHGRSEVTQSVLAYGRARLEDYCRHQTVLADGRTVAQIPSFGVVTEDLTRRGILSDNFWRVHIDESSDDNLTVILPAGWTIHPDDKPSKGDDGPFDPLENERWAGVYDENDTMIVSIFYSNKPLGFSDSFKSYSRILSPTSAE